MRLVWLVVGFAALAAAFVGVALPLIPTTPFLLVAAFAFMKSSKRLHDWLMAHPVFGKLISDWRQYGAISRRTKIVSVGSMAAVIAISLLLQMPDYVLVIQAIVLTASASFIISRPVPPGEVADSHD